MKRIISLLIVTFVLFKTLLLVGFTVSSVDVVDSGKCGDNLSWKLDAEGVLTIFGVGPMYDYVKSMTPAPWYKYRNEPFISEDGKLLLNSDGSEYGLAAPYYDSNPNGYKINKIVIEEGVTYIGDWAFYRVCVDELTIPEGVEEMGYFCIRYSPTITTVTLPNSLKRISDYGISRNYELKTINFGNSLQEIGLAALGQNTSLEVVDLPDSFETYKRLHEPVKGWNDVDDIGLFNGCASLTSVDMGSVTKIAPYMFSNLPIKEIVIPNTVENIDEFAFYKCNSLEKVLFEEDSACKVIASHAFRDCTSLRTITGATALETIGAGAFANANKLECFGFADSNKTFGTSLFKDTDLKYAYVGNNVSSIPSNMFSGCEKLEVVDICNGVLLIKDAAFYNCSSLTQLVIPNSVRTIETDVFYGCTNLKTLVLGSGLDNILKDKFGGINSSAHVVIPESVRVVAEGAFDTSIVIFGKLDSQAEKYALLNGNAFYKTPESIEIESLPDKIEYFVCENCNSINVEGLKLNVKNYDGTTTIINKDYYVSGYLGSVVGEQTITVHFGGQTAEFKISVLEHKTGAEPTCTTNQICTACGTELAPANGHDHKATVTAPTCTEQGYTTYTCHCGDTYVADYVGENGHAAGEWVTVTEAEFGKDGLKEQRCEECGTLLDSEVIPAPTCALGDANMDGSVDYLDYIVVKRQCMGTYTIPEEAIVYADVDGNGTVDYMDYIMLKRHCMGTYVIK